MSLPSRLLARLERELGRGAGLVAILDYDGTLTPIVTSPRGAALAPSVRATLARLAARERARLAILSGRALRDVRARVGVDDVIYGGCHGLEIEGGGLRFRHPRARASRVAAARRALAAGASSIPGAGVEFKGLAVSLQYRRVPATHHKDVRVLAARVGRRLPGLAIIPGNRVYDFVPRVTWNKGAAARWIARRVGPALGPGHPIVLYAGDDATDETAFVALSASGVTVHVGAGPTAAEYALRGVGELHALLRWLTRVIG